MTDADRDDRDSFLECLQDHIHDVHAHVRSHALQIWAKLCTNKCIPLTRQHQILELAVGRLMVTQFFYIFKICKFKVQFLFIIRKILASWIRIQRAKYQPKTEEKKLLTTFKS